MRVDNECSKSIVLFLINFIFNDREDIESRENRVSQLNVIIEVQWGIIITLDGIGSGDNTTSCLQTCNNTSFWDWDTLLFHGFVDTGSILIIHFVKLVNQTDTLIGQD